LDESDVERVVTAVAASDETSTSGTSAGAAALVVALPMECLARVFTFMGTGSDMKIISDIPRLSRHLVLPNKEPKDNKKVLRCCKHLLSQGFCNHGQVVQAQRRANARPVESASFTSVSATQLSCWYCSSIFPYGQDGVQELKQHAEESHSAEIMAWIRKTRKVKARRQRDWYQAGPASQDLRARQLERQIR